MNLSEDVNWCLHEALEHDLPAVHFPEREFRGVMRPAFDRRPHQADHQIEIHAWSQAWANTSLGMGGMAGNAITHATTTVVVDVSARVAAVYVGKFLRGLVTVDEKWMCLLTGRTVISGRYPTGQPYTGVPS